MEEVFKNRERLQEKAEERRGKGRKGRIVENRERKKKSKEKKGSG